MAKDKKQKEKERERRVAKKKLEAAAERRAKEKENSENEKKTGVKKVFSPAPSAKTSAPTAGKQRSFTQRRTGG